MGSSAPARDTPLLIAARNRRDEIIRLLVDHGADIGAKNYEGITPLHAALGTGVMMETIEYMLSRAGKVDVNTQASPNDAAPLMLAAWRGFTGIAEELIKRGARLDTVCGYDGNTALHHAAMKGNLALTELLLSKGADPAIPNKKGLTPAQEAENAGHQDIAELIRKTTGGRK